MNEIMRRSDVEFALALDALNDIERLARASMEASNNGASPKATSHPVVETERVVFLVWHLVHHQCEDQRAAKHCDDELSYKKKIA
jgi:hypothetical protein